MKKILLLVLFLVVASGCATPPIRNPQFKESNLPDHYQIEGIRPVRAYDASLPQTYWASVRTVFNFYGRTPPDTGAMTPRVILASGFRIYRFYDESPTGDKIKYFLTQGHPVIVGWKNPGTAKAGALLLTGFDDLREVFFAIDPASRRTLEWRYIDFPRRRAREWQDATKLVRFGIIIYPKE